MHRFYVYAFVRYQRPGDGRRRRRKHSSSGEPLSKSAKKQPQPSLLVEGEIAYGIDDKRLSKRFSYVECCGSLITLG